MLKELLNNKEYQGRKVLFIVSYGSTNYGTRTADSDNDYKVFLMPTFDDLYSGNLFSSNVKSEGDDYEFHDVRKLVSLFEKSNPTYLETLNAKVNHVTEYGQEIWDWLMANKYHIAVCNLNGYFSAITGMANQKLSAIKKDLPNEPTNEGYNRKIKFGFDTKQLLHIARLMAMRDEVFLKGRSPIDCIDLEQDFPEDSYLYGLKDHLIDIKENYILLNKDSALQIGEKLINNKPKTQDYIVNKITLEQLDDIIKESIKKNFNKGEKCKKEHYMFYE